MERLIHANGVELCAESFGNAGDIPLLLIMGAGASMVWWPDDFCRTLARASRFVIRYDNRDTGRSTCYPPGQPEYGLDDMAADAVAILEAYGIAQANLVGMSLGGMIAQLVALIYPDRVASLTLMMSSIFGPPDTGLPPMDENIPAYHSRSASLDWFDMQAVVEYSVGGWRLLSGSRRPFDEVLVHAIAERDVKRARNLRSMFNHALLKGGEAWYGRIAEINVPTLVIHGTDDPALPYQHGLALAKAIRGSRLLTLEGAGHELHRMDWARISAAVLDLSKGTTQRSAL